MKIDAEARRSLEEALSTWKSEDSLLWGDIDRILREADTLESAPTQSANLTLCIELALAELSAVYDGPETPNGTAIAHAMSILEGDPNAMAVDTVRPNVKGKRPAP